MYMNIISYLDQIDIFRKDFSLKMPTRCNIERISGFYVFSNFTMVILISCYTTISSFVTIIVLKFSIIGNFFVCLLVIYFVCSIYFEVGDRKKSKKLK